jgi:hypothetical protein
MGNEDDGHTDTVSDEIGRDKVTNSGGQNETYLPPFRRRDNDASL